MAVRRRGNAWTGCVLVPLGRLRTRLCNQRRSREGIPSGLWHHIPNDRRHEGWCRRSGHRSRGRAWNPLRLLRTAPQAPYSVHLGCHCDSGLQVPRLNGDADGGLDLRYNGALHGRQVDGLAWRSYRWEHRQVQEASRDIGSRCTMSNRGRPHGRRRRNHDGLGTSIPGPRTPTNMQDVLCLDGSRLHALRWGEGVGVCGNEGGITNRGRQETHETGR